MDTAEVLRRVTVGRITFGIFTAIALWIFFYLIFNPGETRDDRLMNFALGWLLIFVDLPLTLIGAGFFCGSVTNGDR